MSQDKLKKKPIDPEIVRAEEPHPDEVIHVPKGSNKARFLMTFLLVVLVLTTFTVTGPLMDVLGGKDKDFKTYMSWTTPAGEARSLSKKKFQQDKNAYLLVLGVMNGRTPRDINDEQIASFIVLDDAADQAGIRTPDSEVAKVIKATFPNSTVYSDTLRRNRTTNKDTESMLRRIMRANRYRELQMQALSVPDPVAVEDAWRGRHQEYSFDYVEQPVAGLVEEARSQAPKGDELRPGSTRGPTRRKRRTRRSPRRAPSWSGSRSKVRGPVQRSWRSTRVPPTSTPRRKRATTTRASATCASRRSPSAAAP